jgi:nucleoside-diphosphate-sugar epimerase
MDKILVTGGAGYVGSVLVGHLLARGFHVTVLDNLLYGQLSLTSYCTHPKFDFTWGDIRDERGMREVLKRHDAIIPLAAIVGARACDRHPLMARSINFEAIVLLNRLRSPEQRVIMPASHSGYGSKSGDICTEETSVQPRTLYGLTKVQAERVILEAPNGISLRLATVFGPSPRMRLDLLVNDFVYRAVTDGFLLVSEKDFKRNYVHIDDVARCVCFCLEHFGELRGEAYNVGLTEAHLSKAELAMRIRQYVPSLYIHYADIGSDPAGPHYIVSSDKIKAHGFVPQHSLEEGIQQLLKLYRMWPRYPHANA